MASLTKLLTLLIAVKIAGAANDYSSIIIADRCPNAPDFDWTRSVNAYLRQIPETFTLPGPATSSIPGIKLGFLKVTGLGALWTYKPYRSFCVDNQTYIETHVFADKPIRLSVDWKTCSGHHGVFGTRVASNSLRLIFVSGSGEDNNVGISLFKLFPESLEDPALFVEGDSQWLRTAASIANLVTMPHLDLMWRKFLGRDVQYYIDANVRT